MEDIDLEVELGLESKLVNFIERLDLQEIKSNQKTSNDTPSNISEGLGKLPLSNLSLTTDMTKIPAGMNSSQHTFGQKDGEESLSRTSSSESPQAHFPEVSREYTHNCTACEKLGYYWGPPLLVCAPTCLHLRTMTDYLCSIPRDAHTRKGGPVS